MPFRSQTEVVHICSPQVLPRLGALFPPLLTSFWLPPDAPEGRTTRMTCKVRRERMGQDGPPGVDGAGDADDECDVGGTGDGVRQALWNLDASCLRYAARATRFQALLLDSVDKQARSCWGPFPGQPINAKSRMLFAYKFRCWVADYTSEHTSTPCGTRTRNLRIRSPTPCPLGQGG
jgi:hypothetical protein